MSASTPEAGIERLRMRGWTLCTAESLTAGLVAASAANVAGCSDVLRGGVVAYQEAIKAIVLELDSTILSQGVVSREVAEAMAVSARRLLQADVAISTTGVAGPEPHGGEPVGSVWI
ncbi:MAG: CinA family protein, partial [Candidatus Nanopelagicales bacterium]|nr:CinA family protein [Candidatus Nanopelagicales bacterium]